MCCVCTLANDVDCVPKINNKLFLSWCHSFSYAWQGSYVCFYINLIQKCRNVNLPWRFPFIRRTFAMRISEDSARTLKYTIVANMDLDIDLNGFTLANLCTCIALFYRICTPKIKLFHIIQNDQNMMYASTIYKFYVLFDENNYSFITKWESFHSILSIPVYFGKARKKKKW